MKGKSTQVSWFSPISCNSNIQISIISWNFKENLSIIFAQSQEKIPKSISIDYIVNHVLTQQFLSQTSTSRGTE